MRLAALPRKSCAFAEHGDATVEPLVAGNKELAVALHPRRDASTPPRQVAARPATLAALVTTCTTYRMHQQPGTRQSKRVAVKKSWEAGDVTKKAVSLKPLLLPALYGKKPVGGRAYKLLLPNQLFAGCLYLLVIRLRAAASNAALGHETEAGPLRAAGLGESRRKHKTCCRTNRLENRHPYPISCTPSPPLAAHPTCPWG